ncbi:MAG: FliI/YscN family ATPase [Deltaproteobacteria bacterium]|nr:FliI/YscN family ATPase [Deltaproteobacteria bacterium]MCW5808286.1 FliI/YscN family ATPase [Deltaproteobacteria bacterium]
MRLRVRSPSLLHRVSVSRAAAPMRALSAQAHERIASLVHDWIKPQPVGRVAEVAGTIVQIAMAGAKLGDVVEIEAEAGDVLCEVIGFRNDILLAVPLGAPRRIAPGATVRLRGAMSTLPAGDALIGRLIDPFGNPLDGKPHPRCAERVPLDTGALPVEQRGEVEERFDTGVRAIDGLLTCGRGQRIGIFAGAGCGKSVLVEQIASQADADVIVVGLVGERGREVRELMESKRRDRMVMVAATADRSPLERVRGALAATAIAEYFRDRGRNVLLVLDSLTRYAMALRELGLALGEPPATKGYPPSVFATLPRLLERVAPRAGGGAITAFYTVLVEGDDLSDPVADSARSLLDAHIVLSRELAGRGHFPAIDVLSSASRVARRVATKPMLALASRSREQLSRRRQAQELQSLGAYTPGANPALDHALAIGERLDAWARQAPDEPSHIDATVRALAVALGEERAA